MAGCPKCAVDLIRANPHKAAARLPNGFVTFKELREGEVLNLPEKWFSGELDTRPRAYFAALPHMDGVTPSSLGDAASGVLSDYAALDAANAKVSALAAMGDQGFGDAAGIAADAVDASVAEVTGSGSPAVYATPYAQDARKSTAKARARLPALAAAIDAGDSNASFQDRSDILSDLSSAMGSARLALQAFYGDAPVASPSAVSDAARAAVAAIIADPSYCTSVARTGSAVNTAVHAFKTAWNASSPQTSIPINTGNYEQATANALAQVLGSAPAACPPHTGSSQPVATPVAATVVPTGLSTGAVLGIGALGAGVVGGAIYLTTKRKSPRRRRA